MIRHFFIIGSSRSGTTLLRLMLTSHKEIVVPPECGFIQWLAKDYKDWSKQLADSFISRLLRTKKFETWELSASDLQRQLRKDHPRSYAEACQSVVLAYASRTNKTPKVWGDKNNYYINYIPLIISLFPEAQFVYIVRDGRDVLYSYRSAMAIHSTSPYKPKLTLNVRDVAMQWSNETHKAMDLLPEARTTKIRYEDLARTPEIALKKVCHSLKLHFSDDMLNFHRLNESENLEPRETLDWKGKTLNPVDSESVGRYRAELELNEIRIFEQIADDALRAFSYL